jgi:hypothetical protein
MPDDALRKTAWDYFSVHAAQRLTSFNFYIALSSVAVTTYFASFKADSNLAFARPALSGLLCLFSFIFWKLDQRNRFLIKNAEKALKYLEGLDQSPESVTKLFTHEEQQTQLMRPKGWRRLMFWRSVLSYSDCFNLVFLVFFLVGLIGLAYSIPSSRLTGKPVAKPMCPGFILLRVPSSQSPSSGRL